MIFDRFYLPKVHSQVNLLRTISFQQQKISIFVVGIFSLLAVCFSFYFLKKYEFNSIIKNLSSDSTISNLEKKIQINEKKIENLKIENNYFKGLCYYYGSAEYPKNIPRAIELFQLAADKNYPAAINMLGMCYLKGIGVNEDKTKAIELFQLAADKNCHAAINMLGMCYLKGTGVNQDKTKAFEFFVRAAEQDESAQYNLALSYSQGWGTPIDMPQGFYWMMRSAQLNNTSAQYVVAGSFLTGYENLVEKDQKEARKWFHLAAEGGSEEAIKWLENHPI